MAKCKMKQGRMEEDKMEERKTKRYVLSIMSKGERKPLLILACSERTAKAIEKKHGDNLLKYIAGKLHKKYPNNFPDWENESGDRHTVWKNITLEAYTVAYRNLVDHHTQSIVNAYKKSKGKRSADEMLEYFIASEVGWEVHQLLESLPVIKM